MTTVIVIVLALWLAIGCAAYLVWRFRKSEDLKTLPIIMQSFTLGIGLTGVVISLHGLNRATRIERDTIVPKLQVVPAMFTLNTQDTRLKLEIRNFSDHDAVDVRVDVKLGQGSWAKELWKAVSRESFDKYAPSSMKEKFAAHHESYLTASAPLPLPAGKMMKWGYSDLNREFWRKGTNFERLPDGTDRALPFEETPMYKQSLGWQEVLAEVNSGADIEFLTRVSWRSKFGRHCEQIAAYRVVVTRSGAKSSIAFLPDGIRFQNY